MAATSQTISAVDTAWLRMDTDVNLMMIIGVWLLRPVIRYEDLRSRVSERLLKYDRFRQKAVRGAMRSEWVIDDDFELRRHLVVGHLRRKRGQGMRSALQDLMGELAATPLDPEHPLWQFHLIEDYEGGSALICRIHHCIGDGVALNAVMMSLADGGEIARGPGQAMEHPEASHNAGLIVEGVLQPLTEATVKAIELCGETAVKALQALRTESVSLDMLGLARSGLRLLSDAKALALLEDDSATQLKGHGSGLKVVAWCEPLPLDRLKAVGRALGASINDVSLSCMAGAIGSYLHDSGEDPTGKDIRALVPVNLRPIEDAWQLGNRFGLVPLLVPVGIVNPVERLQVIRARMAKLKGSYQPLLAYELLVLSGLLVRPAQKALSNLFLDKTTAVMTNVTGPRDALKLCGATVAQTIFWVPSSGDIGVGVSIMSYAGGVQFGLITDQQLCAQPSRVVDRVATEFEQLQLLALMLPWGEDPVRKNNEPQR